MLARLREPDRLHGSLCIAAGLQRTRFSLVGHLGPHGGKLLKILAVKFVLRFPRPLRALVGAHAIGLNMEHRRNPHNKSLLYKLPE
jgi:hypothetical protein